MKFCSLLLFTFCLSACSDLIKVSPTSLPVIQAPEVAPLNLNDIKWNVLSDIQIKQLAASLTGNKHITLYSLDENNYAILDANLLEMKRYIEEQNQAILFYQQLENNKLNSDSGQQKSK